MAQPEDIGCRNEECKETNNCQRTVIYEDKTAREVKSFGGTPEKGCGNFIARTDGDKPPVFY